MCHWWCRFHWLQFQYDTNLSPVIPQSRGGWGAGVVEQVSLDLQAAFPESKGFSAPNLWFMKKWYLFYSDLAAQEKLYQLGRELNDEKLQQPVREITDEGVPFPAIFAYVPWRDVRGMM